MCAEIPAGTKCKVFGQDGEVLSHMDGVVHVNVNGEAVSVLPEQVELPEGAPQEKKDDGTGDESLAPSSEDGFDPAEQSLRNALVERLIHTVVKMESRVAALEAAANTKLPTNDEGTAVAGDAAPATESTEATPTGDAAADAPPVT
jgi:hypothetical protein